MPVKRICAWCRNEFGITDTEIYDASKISHGICPACFEFQIKEIEISELYTNKF